MQELASGSVDSSGRMVDPKHDECRRPRADVGSTLSSGRMADSMHDSLTAVRFTESDSATRVRVWAVTRTCDSLGTMTSARRVMVSSGLPPSSPLCSGSGCETVGLGCDCDMFGLDSTALRCAAPGLGPRIGLGSAAAGLNCCAWPVLRRRDPVEPCKDAQEGTVTETGTGISL